jgi:hypothetical protein
MCRDIPIYPCCGTELVLCFSYFYGYQAEYTFNEIFFHSTTIANIRRITVCSIARNSILGLACGRPMVLVLVFHWESRFDKRKN